MDRIRGGGFAAHVFRTFSAFLCVVYFFSNCVFANTRETVWLKRRHALKHKHSHSGSVPHHAPVLPRALEAAFPSHRVKTFRNDQEQFGPPLSSFLQTRSNRHGTVRNVVSPIHFHSSSKIIFHIQDIHANTEAQLNISHFIRDLILEKKIDLLALEGTDKSINLERIHTFPRPDVIHKGADYLLKKNLISGAVHATMITPSKLKVIGVDNMEHYSSNVAALKKSIRYRHDAKQRAEDQGRSIEIDKSRTLNSRLAAFDRRIENYKKGIIPFSSALEFLVQMTEESPSQIKLFLETKNLESTLDLKKIEKERGDLIFHLTGFLNEKQMVELRKTTLNLNDDLMTPTRFYEHITQLCDKSGVSISQYENFKKYVRYLFLSDQINPEKLFFEAQELENTAYRHLIISTHEKRILEASRRLHLQTKLIDFSLSSSEWREYKLLRKKTGLASVAAENIRPFEDFYEQAEIRDRAMAENIIDHMNRNNLKSAVIVTGGFHSSGIGKILKKSGSTVIAFAPRLKTIPSGNGFAHLTVFAQEKTPLEKLFEGEKLFLAQNPIAGLSQMPVIAAGLIPEKAPWAFHWLAPAVKAVVKASRLGAGSVEIFIRILSRSVRVHLVTKADRIEKLESVDDNAPTLEKTISSLQKLLRRVDQPIGLTATAQLLAPFTSETWKLKLLKPSAYFNHHPATERETRQTTTNLIYLYRTLAFFTLATSISATAFFVFTNPLGFNSALLTLSIPFVFTVSLGFSFLLAIYPVQLAAHLLINTVRLVTGGTTLTTKAERAPPPINLSDDYTVNPMAELSELKRHRKVRSMALKLMAHIRRIHLESKDDPSTGWRTVLEEDPNSGLNIDFRRFGMDLPKLRIYGPLPNKTSFDSTPTVFTTTDRSIYAEIYRHDNIVLEIIRGIIPHLKGDEMEYDLTSHAHPAAQPEFWTSWENTDSYALYQKSIHPLVSKVIIEILKKPGLRKFHLLDLGGGDGSFLETLYGDLKTKGVESVSNLVLLDHGDHIGAKIKHAPVTRINMDALDIALPDNQIQSNPAIVTALGLLNRDVMKKNTALKIAENVFKILGSEGVFILSGATESLLTRGDLTDIGFDVRNMTVPQNVLSNNGPFQLYIAVKPRYPNFSGPPPSNEADAVIINSFAFPFILSRTMFFASIFLSILVHGIWNIVTNSKHILSRPVDHAKQSIRFSLFLPLTRLFLILKKTPLSLPTTSQGFLRNRHNFFKYKEGERINRLLAGTSAIHDVNSIGGISAASKREQNLGLLTPSSSIWQLQILSYVRALRESPLKPLRLFLRDNLLKEEIINIFVVSDSMNPRLAELVAIARGSRRPVLFIADSFELMNRLKRLGAEQCGQIYNGKSAFLGSVERKSYRLKILALERIILKARTENLIKNGSNLRIIASVHLPLDWDGVTGESNLKKAVFILLNDQLNAIKMGFQTLNDIWYLSNLLRQQA